MIPGPMLAKNNGRDQLMPEMFRIALAAITTSSKVATNEGHRNSRMYHRSR